MATLAVRPTHVLRRNTAQIQKVLNNKLQTKEILEKAGIKTVPTLAVIRGVEELATFDWSTLPQRFVAKPNRGTRTRGVLPIFGRNRYGWFSAQGPVSNEQILRVLRESLAGLNSDAVADTVIIEPMLQSGDQLAGLSPLGVADVQILCDQSLPVAAMLRIPTLESAAITNLSRGAVGARLDISAGITTRAASRAGELELHPDTSNSLVGFRVGNWPEIIEIARQCGPVLGADNLVVELAQDSKLGIVVTEVNPHPGVELQVVCQQPITIGERTDITAAELN